MYSSPNWQVACFLAGLFLLANLFFSRKKTLHLPPGPTGNFLVGVKRQLPALEPWKKYAEWCAQYRSPIISFRVFNRRVIILGTSTAVRDLLDKKAGLYSDRPLLWMFHVLCKRKHSVFNISSMEERHRKYRKNLQGGLGPRATEDYWPLLESEVNILLQGLSSSPEHYGAHIRRNAAAVIMKVAYGYTVSDHNDFFVDVAEESSRITGYASTPGRWLVDYYPLLRFVPTWFPGAGFKTQADIWGRRLDDLSVLTHEWVKSQMASGDFIESFTSRLLQPTDGATVNAEEEDIIKWCSGGLYAGAADTTVSAILSFLMMMALYPKVQQCAQSEIDELHGQENFIGARDLHRFPYLLALMKEVLRFAPVAPLALPHKVIEEDTYCGYRIPKNTTIVANIWAIMHDPSEYPDPFTFDPNRFMSDEASQPDPRIYSFGFGRRTCPGSLFAETSMLLIMSNILSQFNIVPANPQHLDDSVNNVKPESRFTTGITSHIVSFELSITHRRPAVKTANI